MKCHVIQILNDVIVHTSFNLSSSYESSTKWIESRLCPPCTNAL